LSILSILFDDFIVIFESNFEFNFESTEAIEPLFLSVLSVYLVPLKDAILTYLLKY
jgi:hypothetical protein